MGRKRVGIFFSYNINWIGGTYYWLNWINVLNVLPDNEKPVVYVICKYKKDFFFVLKETGYPYLQYRKNRSGYSLFQKAINAITLRILHRRFFVPKLKDEYDAILPAGIGGEYLSLISDEKKINWFPDFQYAYLPELYTADKLVETICRATTVAYLSNKLMLSSYDAKRDFEKLFPNSGAKVYVQHFTVTHPNLSSINRESVLSKHGIDRPFFYVPNQYWAHKNHKVVIDAVEQIVKIGNKDILVLFSGKEWDDRNPDYVPMLKRFVQDNELSDNIKFLGFLDRKEQLVLMKEAKAIIQPSLFEGWSTVIEDAKALNKYVIASNIDVNVEQINTNCSFFNPNDSDELASLLSLECYDVVNTDYNMCRVAQATNFMKMINN